ncbi:GDSL-type esterase/lipase family protein [Sphingobium sp. CR2-8]|uniref:GDSL-type esterase/lipase family protein n=1 Tax=Sphingobium sp. CR2-8 TaxID=1306534 RepID=UPI002DBA076E|nr:GDSL-type esterase/lipase family protein [Sphingobium sp. CR2-8]MEC3912742.1 GDSL-type esterase/lipase family protein [Sphingobium sp. CR2-8]
MRSIDASPLAKLLVALLVFAVIIVGWRVYGRYRESQAVLPESGMATGDCALWFVGSSSIHRWISLQRDMAPWKTENRGINGAVLTDILPRFANIKAREGRPRALILYVGENDIAGGVPVRTVMRQLAGLFDLRDRLLPDVPVLLLSAKPSPGRASFMGEQRLFNAAARNFLPHMRAAYYGDITTPLMVDGKLGDNYQPDGVHMNARGYRIWADVVRQRLVDILPPDVTRRCAP